MRLLENALPTKFYDRHTPDVARDLLGSILNRRSPDGHVLSGRIVEAEAYRFDEPACHASRGLTPRTKIMFGPPGVAYVYFIYGVYHCLNVVTEAEGSACAVLIRAVEGENTNGPGKLCRQWDITKAQNGVVLTDPASELWITEGQAPSRREIGTSSRIGVTSAEHLKWRYFIKGHRNVSGPKSYNC